MKYLISAATIAAAIACGVPAMAQNSAPGTPAQGATASSSMNGNEANGADNGTMSNGSMTANHAMKKKKHSASSMNSTGSTDNMVNNKAADSGQPGTKSNGN